MTPMSRYVRRISRRTSRHCRLYSQLPGYNNWGREVRGLLRDQCTEENTNPSINPCRIPNEQAHPNQSTPRKSSTLQCFRKFPPSSATPHGPSHMTPCPDGDKRQPTRRAKIFPGGPAHKVPPRWADSLNFSRFLVMTCTHWSSPQSSGLDRF